MMKKSLFCGILFLIYNAAFGQNMDYVRQIIDTLSSPYFSGRGYVDQGVRKASLFITDQFKEAGVEPFGKEYAQQFSIPVNIFYGNVSLEINGSQLSPGIDFLPEPYSPSVKGSYNVFAIKDSVLLNEEEFIRILGTAGDKFLVIDTRNQKPDSEAIEKRLKMLIFSRRCSAAGIILLTGDKLSWGVSGFVNTIPVFRVNTNHPLSYFKEVKVDLTSRFDSHYKTSNILGYIKGKEVPDTFIVITAHYDHLGKLGKKVLFPGANDNASGVAMMLSLAEYYNEHRPEYSIVFIAFSAEEAGLLGSKYFVEHPLFNLQSIKFLINFDLAGTGDEGIKVVNATEFSREFSILQSINNQDSLLSGVFSRGPAANSDHWWFYEEGVPCFFIYTLGGIKAYHDIYDRPETLPLTGFQGYYKLMIRFFNQL